jgi:voltage-gated potassium channel
MAREQPWISRQLRLVVVLFGLLVAAGTVGYSLIEGWSPTESLYMTVITLSTVGFGEVRPLTPGGRAFTVALILVGVGGVAYLFSSLAEYVVAGELQGTLQRRRMQHKIDGISNHYIVCGYGRVGRHVARELEANGAQVVVIDIDSTKIDRAERSNLLFIVGDASDDEVLQRAGIARARGLVAATGNDADNVFITLSARSIRQDLTIVVRAIMPDSEHKLRMAGADHVVLPHAIGGRRMAGMLMRPTVVDFLDVVMHSENLELWLEDIPVGPGCQLANCSVGDALIRTRTGANVLAIRTAEGKLQTNVSAADVLGAGDVVVALGTREQLHALAVLAGATEAR